MTLAEKGPTQEVEGVLEQKQEEAEVHQLMAQKLVGVVGAAAEELPTVTVMSDCQRRSLRPAWL